MYDYAVLMRELSTNSKASYHQPMKFDGIFYTLKI